MSRRPPQYEGIPLADLIGGICVFLFLFALLWIA